MAPNPCLLTLLLFVCSISSIRAERFTEFRQVSPDKYNDEAVTAKLLKVSDTSETLNESAYTPIVFWHGMGDTAYGSINSERLALQKLFANVSIFSVQVGTNAMEDRMASYFSNANTQIDDVCREILADPVIKAHKSFNAVGYSQGSQLLRGLIQRCPFLSNGIKVKNFISLGGQHQGVFGLPNCLLKGFCTYINYLLSEGAYEEKIQSSLIQAAYWHDPTKESLYRERSIFIADLNNEKVYNSTYKHNLQQLDNLVLVGFEHDRMVIPRESSLFGFYEAGSTSKIVPLERSELYTQDKLGLRSMSDMKRLHQIIIPGDHLQYKMKWFIDEIALVYLNN